MTPQQAKEIAKEVNRQRKELNQLTNEEMKEIDELIAVLVKGAALDGKYRIILDIGRYHVYKKNEAINYIEQRGWKLEYFSDGLAITWD